MTLLFLNYNNYYNRIFKKEDTLAGYRNYLLFEAQNNNFVIADGIHTTVDIGIPSFAAYTYNGNANYVVAYDEGTGEMSRWFILEQEILRQGQYRATLRRDLLVDFLPDWWDKPAYVEKGYLQPNDPFIFQAENASFNQIKRQEIPLKDPTNCPWVVGYVTAPKVGDEALTVTYGIDKAVPDYTVTNINEWEYANYVSTPFKYYNQSVPRLYLRTLLGDRIDIRFNKHQNYVYSQEEGEFTASGGYTFDDEYLDIIKTIIKTRANKTSLDEAVCNQFGLSQDKDKYNEIKNLDGQIIKIGEDYKKIGVIVESEKAGTINDPLSIAATSAVGTYLANLVAGINVWAGSDWDIQQYPIIAGAANNESFGISYTYMSARIILLPTESSIAYNFTIAANRRKLKDSPYCMFCMPYSDTYKIEKVENGVTNTYTTIKENALSIASAVASSITDANLYDIQLLPYCPIAKLRDMGETADLAAYGGEEGIDYITENLLGQNQIIFWATYSSHTFNIPFAYNVSGGDSIDFKVGAETVMMRLCSPNYNGVFEFSPHKNGGISYINVDLHYKPYQPYIHLNPNFGSLYGEDFNDARGLILGGDFSIATLSDKWKDYEIQNKNYQAMFNRQIENMEFQNRMGRIQDTVGAFAGAVSAGSSGFMAGMIGSGGNIGVASATAGISGALSLGAGFADIYLNQKSRNEALDYTKDMFALTLDNIKALPNSLTRISSLNNNNKIWPFIEVYEATDEEKTALRQKIVYNGMTINRIDTISNIYSNKPSTINLGYFKAKVIRLPDEQEDFHLANELAAEINKGVYM